MNDKESLARAMKYFHAMRDTVTTGYVDDATAADMHLNRIFRLMDTTRTDAGRSILYHFLRVPCPDRESMEHRLERLDTLAAHGEFRRKCEGFLRKVGFNPDADLVDELWNYVPVAQVRYLPFLRLWIAVSLLSLLSPLALGTGAVLTVILPVVVTNIIIHARMHGRIGAHIASLSALFRLIRCAKRILAVKDDCPLPEIEELRAVYRNVRKLPSGAAYLSPSTGASGDILALFLEYLKIFLLAELHAFLATFHRIGGHLEDLRRLYEIIGTLDASLCLLRFIDAHPDTICRAEFDEPTGSDGVGIEFRDLRHPLVQKCVGNSLRIEGGIVLTGTNMSGKSTFLRTLGVNQVCATALGFAFASSFRTDFFTVISSLSLSDDLHGGKSRYFVEAERLLVVLTKVRSGTDRFLVLIDEILSGTNSEDRITASIGILRTLSRSGSVIIAATHDLAIARATDEWYGNYHFSEKIGSAALDFDYTIQEGIVDERNALRILRYLGFPEDIVRGA